MSCGAGRVIQHCWELNGMEFVYKTKTYGNEEEMEMLVECAIDHNVSMIYTAETFNDCGEKEIKPGVYGIWIQVNDPGTRKENIEKMWADYKSKKVCLLTGWHERSGDC
jgi:hypothetical protein